jgi:hypothetical protein
MNKIELSELEKRVIKIHINKGFEPMQHNQLEYDAFMSVLHKGDMLMRELDAYDDVDDEDFDMAIWLWKKYIEQEKRK